MASHNETSVSEVSSASSDFSDFSASDYDRKRLRVLLHNVTEWQKLEILLHKKSTMSSEDDETCLEKGI